MDACTVIKYRELEYKVEVLKRKKSLWEGYVRSANDLFIRIRGADAGVAYENHIGTDAIPDEIFQEFKKEAILYISIEIDKTESEMRAL